MANKYILTGGPGVGKTTLIDRLAAQNYQVLHEQARQIIEQESEKEQGILPWTKPQEFEDLVWQQQLNQEQILDSNITFLDRGLPDVIAYVKHLNTNISYQTNQAIRDANYTRVFILEPLPFYVNDAQRKEDQEDAQKLHHTITNTYEQLGFDIVHVPVTDSIESRVQFILDNLVEEEKGELEQKFRVDSLEQVHQQLNNYQTIYQGQENQDNYVAKLGKHLLRVRTTPGKALLTIKGPNISNNYLHRSEWETQIDNNFAEELKNSTTSFYHKVRDTYTPLPHPDCLICLDHLPEIGDFVEIEAPSKNQIELWKKRLNLASVCETDYTTLADKQ